MRPGREPNLRERDIRDRERLLPEGLMQQHERERERDRERDSRGERGGDRDRDRMLMMMDLPQHGDLRTVGRGDTRQDRSDYEPLLPREVFSPQDTDKTSNSHHLGVEREHEKADSIDGKLKKQTRE